ncbi:MAG: GIY-YIG nuclease family protein [Patescibacteria group bacterium]|nr:GIY-YIG nuclease family protein [Patescibacteria group bacterium]
MKDKKLYIGCTASLKDRLEYHNNGYVRSTKSRRPLALIYSEGYENLYKAFEMERFYKSAKGKKVLKRKLGTIYSEIV